MRFDPKTRSANRDRFVLSNGHCLDAAWSVLHLTGTQAVKRNTEHLGKPSVTLDDIRHFRQLDSKAPGHPEYHWVSGVETTTGPLGQASPPASAWRWRGAGFPAATTSGLEAGSGLRHLCGVRRTAAPDGRRRLRRRPRWPAISASTSCAGSTTTITSPSEGKTSITFTEDVAARFLAYRWNVLRSAMPMICGGSRMR